MKHELSKERLAQYANDPRMCNINDEIRAMARALLAAHEQEPDYIRYDCGCCGFETIDEWRDNDVCPKCNHKPLGKTELFTHPAPSIPAAPECGRGDFEKFCRSIPAGDQELAVDANGYYKNNKVHYMWKAWNACRAAMLQSEPVSNIDELPLDYLQGHKDGLEWAAQLAEANHPQTGDWLYDDPIALAAAIRKGPDIPELKSEFADEDDNFYSWFGRFWLENYQQNNYTTSAKQMLGTMAEFAYRAGRESAALAGNSQATPDGWQLVPKEPTEAMNKAGWDAMNEHDAINPTYRAMLAAAPQLPGSEPATVPGKWIPVSERLPDEVSSYWCYVEEQNSLGKSHYQWNCSWNGDEWSDASLTGRVTHWQPLPAAPKVTP